MPEDHDAHEDTRPSLLELLACPQCHLPLSMSDSGAHCAACDRDYPRRSGILDFVPETPTQRRSLGQSAMQFPPLTWIYERVWRPAFTLAAALGDPVSETRGLARRLALDDGARVLDVACGPGNTTRVLAETPAVAHVLGVDLSTPMLRQALRETPSTRTAPVDFVRADAHRLPVTPGGFDGAHTAAALYLFTDPATVLAGIAAALRPGGRLVGMTIRRTPLTGAGVPGVRYTSPRDLERWLRAAGLVDITLDTRLAVLRFSADKPALRGPQELSAPSP